MVTLYGYARVESYVHQYVANDMLAKGIAIGGLFLVTLLIVSLLTVKMSDVVLDSRIGALDRSLGFIFGLARGLVIMVVAFLFFQWLVPAKSQPEWVMNARSRVVLEATGDWILSLLPDDPETAILRRLRPGSAGEEPMEPGQTPPQPMQQNSPVQTVPQQPDSPVRTVPDNSGSLLRPSRLASTFEAETGYKRSDRQGLEQLLEVARGAPH